MKNEFDIGELMLIKRLVEEKIEEVKDSEYFEHTKKILKSTLEKLNDCLGSNEIETTIEAIAKLEKKIISEQETIEKYRELNKTTGMEKIIATAEESLELSYKLKQMYEKRLDEMEKIRRY